MKQTVVKTYNSTELGGIAGSLLAGGALSADGILSHPVVFGTPRPAADADDEAARFRATVMNDPNPGPGMHKGFVSIDVKTGELLHAHNGVSIGSFFRYF